MLLRLFLSRMNLSGEWPGACVRECVRLCSCKEPLEIISGLIVTRPPLGRRDKRETRAWTPDVLRKNGNGGCSRRGEGLVASLRVS